MTGTGHNDLNLSPIGIFNSSIDVPRPRRNIDNYTGMKTQGPIMSIILEYNKEKNCDVFDLVRNTSDISYRVLTWHGTMKIKSENTVKKLRDNNIFKNDERKNIFEVEKVGRKNSVIWDHKDSDSIHANPDHTNSNQLIPEN